MKKIVIVGGAGFIGTKLSEALLEMGYAVLVVGPSAPKIRHENLEHIICDLSKGSPEVNFIDGTHGVVNLAGATIGKRWNSAYKKLLYSSRIETTKTITTLIISSSYPPSVLVNASGIGYYGDQGTEPLDENCSQGGDFLAKLCVDWEGEAMKANSNHTRVVLVRTANVLGPAGLLASLYPLFKVGLGGYFGSGKQLMPWIHWKDIVGIYIFAIENLIAGAYNASAPEVVSQKYLFKLFGKTIHAPFVLPVPYFLGKIALGEFADALFAGQNAVSKKICDAGYKFSVNEIKSAFKDIYPEIG